MKNYPTREALPTIYAWLLALAAAVVLVAKAFA